MAKVLYSCLPIQATGDVHLMCYTKIDRANTKPQGKGVYDTLVMSVMGVGLKMAASPT